LRKRFRKKEKKILKTKIKYSVMFQEKVLLPKREEIAVTRKQQKEHLFL